MKVLIPLAEGFEEMEAVTVVDILRRAGWEVVTAGFSEGPVAASRGVLLQPDALWSDVRDKDFDILLIPGGADGVRRLCGDETVLEKVRLFHDRDNWLAAICAGPLVFEAAGILSGRRVTAYPSVTDRLASAVIEDTAVVRDGRLITSRGPGTAVLFGLTLVACLEPGKADAIAAAMVCGPEVTEFLARARC